MWRILQLYVLIVGAIPGWAQTSCTTITALSSLQTVITGGSGSELTVCLDGGAPDSVWSMAEEAPLTIEQNQKVAIDCQGAAFEYHSNYGNITLGQDSVLEYQNCDLQNFDYPEGLKVFGSTQQFKDSLIGMRSCRFVTEISNQYAQILIAAQSNATLLLGELVSEVTGSAITMFFVAYDSLNEAAPVRFVHNNCTVYCGDKSVAVAEALQLADENGPVVTVSSESFAAQSGARETPVVEEEAAPPPSDDSAPSWFIAVVTISGVALIGMGVVGYYLWRGRKRAKDAASVQGPDTSKDDSEQPQDSAREAKGSEDEEGKKREQGDKHGHEHGYKHERQR